MESRAEDLLIELAGGLEDADVRGLAPGTWLVALDEELAVVLELDADRGVLVLSTDLGHPPVAHRSTVHTLLLQASALAFTAPRWRRAASTASMIPNCSSSPRGGAPRHSEARRRTARR